MDFKKLKIYIPIKSELDLIDYRNKNKNYSSDIAMFVFDQTHPGVLSFDVPEKLQSIRFEFGALEAPGLPEDDFMPLEEFDDKLWARLEKLITNIK